MAAALGSAGPWNVVFRGEFLFEVSPVHDTKAVEAAAIDIMRVMASRACHEAFHAMAKRIA